MQTRIFVGHNAGLVAWGGVERPVVAVGHGDRRGILINAANGKTVAPLKGALSVNQVTNEAFVWHYKSKHNLQR